MNTRQSGLQTCASVLPIRTEADYDRAMARVDVLMELCYGTKYGSFNWPLGEEELIILATECQKYELDHDWILTLWPFRI
jgi:hypothetical protein